MHPKIAQRKEFLLLLHLSITLLFVQVSSDKSNPAFLYQAWIHLSGFRKDFQLIVYALNPLYSGEVAVFWKQTPIFSCCKSVGLC